MISSVGALLLLACAASAQFYGGYYGYSGIPWTYTTGAVAPAVAPVAPVTYKTTPYAYNAVPYTFSPYQYAPVASSSQYHAQDELGQASFGYAHPGQAAANYRDAWGNQVGSYAYINPEGKEVKVSYVADSNGFRVLSNDLPVAPVADLAMPTPVEDTPEVSEARAAHLAAIEDARNGVVAPLPEAPAVELPVPVEDTPEVAAAKAEHAEAHAAAKAAAEAAPERKRRQAILPLPLAYSAPLIRTAPVVSVAAPAVAVRDATLTKTVLTPGHAVAYRVD